MTRKFITGLSVVLLIGLVLPGEAVQAYDKAEYNKINGEMTCQCGCGLLVSECRHEGCMCIAVRAKVATMLDSGKTEPEILKAMVASYGTQILAAPPKSGFNLSAYVLPFLMIVLGGGILFSVVSHWTPAKQRVNPESENQEPNDSTEDIDHLDQIEDELEKLDL